MNDDLEILADAAENYVQSKVKNRMGRAAIWVVPAVIQCGLGVYAVVTDIPNWVAVFDFSVAGAEVALMGHYVKSAIDIRRDFNNDPVAYIRDEFRKYLKDDGATEYPEL